MKIVSNKKEVMITDKSILSIDHFTLTMDDRPQTTEFKLEPVARGLWSKFPINLQQFE